METPSRPSFHAKLNPSLSPIGRALAGGNLAAISRAVFACDALRDLLLKKVTATMDAELMQLCKRSRNLPSPFRRVPIDAMPLFQWGDCIAELNLRAPTLLQVVTALVNKMTIVTSRNSKMCTIQESALLSPLC